MNLIISPHPDDAEYSVSGTVLKNKNEQYDIFIFSTGGDNDPTKYTHNRINECLEFWKGIPNVKILAFQSKDSIDEKRDWEIVAVLDELLKSKKYNTVYTTPLEDNHFEHRKISEAARAALRGNAISLIEYHTPSVHHTWSPNLFVDINNFYAEKKQRLKTFQSQIKQNYFAEHSIDIFHDDYFCKLRSVDKVEKFKIIYKFDL
jgi:LmbE family N-acetylglucosaminyl deacetylase